MKIVYLIFLAFLSIFLTSSLGLNLYKTKSSVGQPLDDQDNQDINMHYIQTDTPKSLIQNEGFIDGRYIKDVNDYDEYNAFEFDETNNFLDNFSSYKDKQKDLKIRKKRNTYESHICNPEFEICNDLQYLNRISCDIGNRLSHINFTAPEINYEGVYKTRNDFFFDYSNVIEFLQNEISCKAWNSCNLLNSLIFDLSSIAYNTNTHLIGISDSIVISNFNSMQRVANKYLTLIVKNSESCNYQTNKDLPRLRQKNNMIPGLTCKLNSNNKNCHKCEKINAFASTCRNVAESLLNDFNSIYPTETKKKETVYALQSISEGLKTDINILFKETNTFKDCQIWKKCDEIKNIVYELRKIDVRAKNLISYINSLDLNSTPSEGKNATLNISKITKDITKLIFDAKENCTQRVYITDVLTLNSTCYDGGSKPEFHIKDEEEKRKQDMVCKSNMKKKEEAIKNIVKEIVAKEISAIPECTCTSTKAPETNKRRRKRKTNPATLYPSTKSLTQEEMLITTEDKPLNTTSDAETSTQDQSIQPTSTNEDFITSTEGGIVNNHNIKTNITKVDNVTYTLFPSENGEVLKNNDTVISDALKTNEQSLTDERPPLTGFRHFGSKTIIAAASLLRLFGYSFNTNIF